MAQTNKLCPTCNTVGHSKFYCPDKPKTPLKRTPIKPQIRDTTKVRKPKTKKAPTRKQIVKKLDDTFSLYIRQKTADEFGMVQCVTSGEIGHWKTMHAGHFYTRGRYPTRWDETNVHVQSVRSNIFLKGDYINYTRYMIDRYGREYVDELEIKSLSGTKFTNAELLEKIEYYKGKQNA